MPGARTQLLRSPFGSTACCLSVLAGCSTWAQRAPSGLLASLPGGQAVGHGLDSGGLVGGSTILLCSLLAVRLRSGLGQRRLVELARCVRDLCHLQGGRLSGPRQAMLLPAHRHVWKVSFAGNDAVSWVPTAVDGQRRMIATPACILLSPKGSHVPRARALVSDPDRLAMSVG